MGLRMVPWGCQWPVYDLGGQSVLDLGGGPVSMLLKAVNGSRLTVVDPAPYPDWVRARYEAAGITYVVAPAEGYLRTVAAFEECWVYNVLQHVQDPESVIRAAQFAAPVIRLFEWLDVEPEIGHPHVLRAEDLDRWLGGTGQTEVMDENGCVGRAYYGVFG